MSNEEQTMSGPRTKLVFTDMGGGFSHLATAAGVYVGSVRQTGIFRYLASCVDAPAGQHSEHATLADAIKALAGAV